MKTRINIKITLYLFPTKYLFYLLIRCSNLFLGNYLPLKNVKFVHLRTKSNLFSVWTRSKKCKQLF